MEVWEYVGVRKKDERSRERSRERRGKYRWPKKGRKRN